MLCAVRQFDQVSALNVSLAARPLQEVMVDPVIAGDGDTHERAATMHCPKPASMSACKCC